MKVRKNKIVNLRKTVEVPWWALAIAGMGAATIATIAGVRAAAAAGSAAATAATTTASAAASAGGAIGGFLKPLILAPLILTIGIPLALVGAPILVLGAPIIAGATGIYFVSRAITGAASTALSVLPG